MVWKKAKGYWQELKKVHSSPHEIAFGFAAGAFIAILPTPGFSVLLGLLVVLLYPKTSKLALFAALALLNPLTLIPFQVLSYKVGSLLFGAEPVIKYDVVILDTVYNFTRRYLVGNVLVSSFFAGVSYPIVRSIASVFRKWGRAENAGKGRA